MSAASTAYPTPDPATSLRLRACVLAFAIIGLSGIWKERDSIPGLIIHITSFPVLVWEAWIGTHRSPSLHRLWGVVSLVASVALFVLLVVIAFNFFGSEGLRPRSSSRSPLNPLPMLLAAAQMPVLAYLLLFDRRVAAFRRQLADRETASPKTYD
jgi:hypothetical protein